MDVHSGELRALVSVPGYDPNPFNHGLSAKDWEELLSNPRAPLTNKAVAGQYPPGSTFKMVVGLAALEAGMAAADTSFYYPGHLVLGDTRFHCWKRGGHRSEEHTSELQSLMRISYAVLCLKKKKHKIYK